MSYWLDILYIVYFSALNGTYALLIALAMIEIIQRRANRMPEFDNDVLGEASTPPITILAPAFNEETGIVDSVHAFLQLTYPNLQVIVINDGSSDGTLNKLKERFELKPIHRVVQRQLETRGIKVIYQSATDSRLLVVDKERGGKADALNVGLNIAQTPLICAVDSDTLIDRRALLRMVEPFLYDRQTMAVGGSVYIANTCDVKDGLCRTVSLPKSWLARFQIIEYLRAFLFGRLGLNRLGGTMLISGAFGLFLRDALIEIGGYRRDTVGEDMEMIVRLHRTMRDRKKPFRIKHIPDPVSYTEAPETVRTLGRQRDRWQRGLAETLAAHQGMFLNPKYGLSGLFTYPTYLLFELFGPIIELSGYIWFVYSLIFRGVDPQIAMLYFIVAFLFGTLLSIQSIILDSYAGNVYQGFKLRLRLVAVALLEYFGYRQITLYYRIKGFFRYLLGEKSWGVMTRKGFAKRATS